MHLMEWVNRVSDPFLNQSAVGIISDIPIHSKNRGEHEVHPRQVLLILRGKTGGPIRRSARFG